MSRRKNAAAQLDDAFAQAKLPTPGASELEDDTQLDNEVDDEAEEAVSAHQDDDDPLEALRRDYAAAKAEAERLREESEQAKADAQIARQAAENFRRQASERGGQVQQASLAAVESSIGLTESNIRQLKLAIRQAGEEGDWDTVANAQEALSQNSTYLSQLRADKQSIENLPAEEKYQPFQGVDEADAIISKFSPRSQEWLRKHKDDIFKSPQRQALAQAAHNMAVARGHIPDSDSYFAEIDRQMEYTQNKPPQQRAQASTPAAPPARSQLGQQRRNNEMRLTKEEQETALMIFSDKKPEDALALYAEGKKQIISGNSHLTMSANKYRGM